MDHRVPADRARENRSATHRKMPFKIRRSSTRATPRGLFGSIGLINAHSASLKSDRAISSSPAGRINHASTSSGFNEVASTVLSAFPAARPHRSLLIPESTTANLPATSGLRSLAATIKARWICEQAHQQLKEELGLDHFEGRSWRGLMPSSSIAASQLQGGGKQQSTGALSKVDLHRAAA